MFLQRYIVVGGGGGGGVCWVGYFPPVQIWALKSPSENRFNKSVYKIFYKGMDIQVFFVKWQAYNVYINHHVVTMLPEVSLFSILIKSKDFEYEYNSCEEKLGTIFKCAA